MIDNFRSPIFVVGVPRSRTSMTTAIISLCGAWCGNNFYQPDHANPKGYYEHRGIKDKILKPLLAEAGFDPLGQNPLPPRDFPKDAYPDDLAGSVYDIIGQDEYDGSPWIYKDTKMLLCWQVWHRAFPDAKWVMVRRDQDDIINSCLRTNFMTAYNSRDGWAGFITEHLQRFQDMKNAGIELYEISSDDIVQGNFNNLRNMIKWLGFEWNERAIKDFIIPNDNKFGQDCKKPRLVRR